jgi:hypothetical protein
MINRYKPVITEQAVQQFPFYFFKAMIAPTREKNAQN